MSSSIIDQLLPIAATARPTTEMAGPASSSETSVDRAPFQEHLQRAASEAQPSQETAHVKAPAEPKDETLEPSDQGQDAAASQQDGATAASEPEEQTVTQAEEEPKDNDDSNKTESDDLTLSDEATAAADPLATTTVEAETETEVEIPTNSTANEEETLPTKPATEVASTEAENEKSQIPVSNENVEKEDKPNEKSAPPAEMKVAPITKPQTETEEEENSDQPKIADTPDGEQPARKDVRVSGVQTSGNHDKSESEEKATTPAQQQPSTSQEKTTDIQAATEASEPPAKNTPSRGETGAAPSVASAAAQTAENKQAAEIANKAANLVPVVATTEDNTSPAPPAIPNGEIASATQRPAAGSPSTHSSLPSDASPESDPVPTADRVRFVHRVSGAIRSAQNRDGQIQLRLSPPELGSLRIEITVNRGAVTARLEAETSAARNVLLDNLPALRERLAEQEIRIEKFDVDVRRDGSQQQGNPETQDRTANRSPTNTARAQRTDNQQETHHVTTANLESTTTLDSRLDVRI